MEVELSPRTVEDNGGAVVRSGGVFGGGERPKPLARPLSRLTDLSNPFSPAPLPHTTVSEFVVVRSTFAFALTVINGGVGVGGGDVVIVTAVAVFTVRCFAGSGGDGGGGGGFGDFLGRVMRYCCCVVHLLVGEVLIIKE